MLMFILVPKIVNDHLYVEGALLQIGIILWPRESAFSLLFSVGDLGTLLIKLMKFYLHMYLLLKLNFYHYYL